MPSEAARTLSGVANSVVLVSSLVTTVGVALIVGPGYLNPRRFGNLFIGIGTIGFFVPGLLGLIGGVFLRRERRGWPWGLALAGVLMQFVVAAGFFVTQFFVSPISLVPLAVCWLWACATAILLWRLIFLRGALRADADMHRGFVIEATTPRETPRRDR